MSLEFWYMLPAAILIATVAMASGVEGATFFSPLFILALGLSPEVAIATGLVTEVFGFGSGLYAYARRRLIDYRLAGSLLLVTVPLALVGVWIAGLVEADVLKAVLGVGLFAVALSFLRSPSAESAAAIEADIQRKEGSGNPDTCLTTAEGESICYSVCNRTEGRLIAGVGGAFMGMTSTGLGEMNGYFLLQRCRVPGRVAVATSVLVVAVTALVASAAHATRIAGEAPDALPTILGILVFTVPGVIVGAQVGSAVARHIPQRALTIGMGALFILVAALLLGEVALGAF